jgi:hypothetical protein
MRNVSTPSATDDKLAAFEGETAQAVGAKQAAVVGRKRKVARSGAWMQRITSARQGVGERGIVSKVGCARSACAKPGRHALQGCTL